MKMPYIPKKNKKLNSENGTTADGSGKTKKTASKNAKNKKTNLKENKKMKKQNNILNRVKVLDTLPEGWKWRQGATTAPHGYRWAYNGKSMFGGEYKQALICLASNDLAKARLKELEYFANVSGLLTEFDQAFNDIQREKIDAFKRLHGGAYLVNMDKLQSVKASDCELVHNFEFDFIVKTKQLADFIINTIKEKGLTGKIEMIDYTSDHQTETLHLLWV